MQRQYAECVLGALRKEWLPWKHLRRPQAGIGGDTASSDGWPEVLLERSGRGGQEGDGWDGDASEVNEFVTNYPPSHSALCFLALLPLVARMWGKGHKWTELSSSDSAVHGNEHHWSMWGISLVWLLLIFHPLLHCFLLTAYVCIFRLCPFSILS